MVHEGDAHAHDDAHDGNDDDDFDEGKSVFRVPCSVFRDA
jgi:hypothetical protein